jgi:hypothetical protein
MISILHAGFGFVILPGLRGRGTDENARRQHRYPNAPHHIVLGLSLHPSRTKAITLSPVVGVADRRTRLRR